MQASGKVSSEIPLMPMHKWSSYHSGHMHKFCIIESNNASQITKTVIIENNIL